MRQEQYDGRALQQEVVLAQVLDKMAKGKFNPFFTREEANSSVREEVLNKYGEGRYADWKKLAAIGDWNDLINNTFDPIVTNLNAAKVTLELPLDPDIVLDLQMAHRRLKLIEDWIYFNPDVQKAIRAQISAYTG
jgi:hypothetical protein